MIASAQNNVTYLSIYVLSSSTLSLTATEVSLSSSFYLLQTGVTLRYTLYNNNNFCTDGKLKT